MRTGARIILDFSEQAKLFLGGGLDLTIPSALNCNTIILWEFTRDTNCWIVH